MKAVDMTKVLAIVGPTGSGKSTVATALAKRLDGEIISCDSVQVYRGFDIGSAKPSLDEQRSIPHHCIDIRDWSESFDAQQFRELAREAIADCRSRGKVPIVCGGTGLYLRVLRWGLVEGPGSNEKLREQLENDERSDPGSLVRRLLEADPEAGACVDLKNPRRVIRSLEIFLLSGTTPTELRREHGFRVEETPMNVVCVDWPNDTLRERLGSRMEQMLNAGWVDEVRQLLDSGVSKDCIPMTAVGYRTLVESVDTPMNREELTRRILKTTWSYVRRQRTWMRKEKDVRLISREEFRELQSVVDEIEKRAGL